MLEGGHEQVVLVADRGVGLRAVIAIHSTALGPSLGGVRFWCYPAEDDAVRDALALAEAMTWKAALAGLHQGGGKAVVLVEDPDAAHPEPMLATLGRAIDELGGRYLAAEDVGASTADMDLLATITPWVTGVDEAAGGSGDPSPVTAFGVLAALRAVARTLDGPDATLTDRRVAIQGAGKVGGHLARLAADAGMDVIVADRDDQRARAVAARCGGRAVPADDILHVDCDMVAPCALGRVLDPATVSRLACRAVCGAANDQLAGPGVDRLLAAPRDRVRPRLPRQRRRHHQHRRGVHRLHAVRGVGPHRVDRAHHRGRARRGARRTGTTPERVAMTRARTRVRDEGAGRRWHPGDPAAWTHGEALRRLRPAGTVA